MAVLVRPQAENTLVITGDVDVSFVSDETHFAWIRWIHASVNKHFTDIKGNYDLYLEGDERTTQEDIEFAELRMDGPFITIPQKNLYIIDVEINVLVQTHMRSETLYNIQKLIGVFLRGFTNIIPIYRYGTEETDDDSLLGCLHLQRDLRESIDINYFGIVRPDTRLTQATLEGHYRLELWKEGE